MYVRGRCFQRCVCVYVRGRCFQRCGCVYVRGRCFQRCGCVYVRGEERCTIWITYMYLQHHVDMINLIKSTLTLPAHCSLLSGFN